MLEAAYTQFLINIWLQILKTNNRLCPVHDIKHMLTDLMQTWSKDFAHLDLEKK